MSLLLQLRKIVDGSIIARSEASDAHQCLITLLKILQNCRDNPFEPKFRTIRAHGNSIQQVLKCEGGRDVLLLSGFSKTYIYNFKSLELRISKNSLFWLLEVSAIK
jgi:hypothetical protein